MKHIFYLMHAAACWGEIIEKMACTKVFASSLSSSENFFKI